MKMNMSCICCSVQSIERKCHKITDSDDAISFFIDLKKLICQNCDKFQFLACAKDMYTRALESGIPQEALGHSSWLQNMKKILSEACSKATDNVSSGHVQIPKGICCSFFEESFDDVFVCTPIPQQMKNAFDSHDNFQCNITCNEKNVLDSAPVDHNEQVMAFRRQFKSGGNKITNDADEAKLSFLFSYHHSCGQSIKAIRTCRPKHHVPKRQRRSFSIQMNNIFSGALYLPAFSLLIQSQVRIFLKMCFLK